MTIQLSEATEAAIAQKHDDAAAGITGLAGAVPQTVDGGYATADLMAILAAVVGTADDLALVNEVAADQVRAVGQGLGDTDDEVGDAFRSMEVVIPR